MTDRTSDAATGGGDILRQPAHVLLATLESGELTAVALATAALERIAETDVATHAFLTVTSEVALEQAAAVDADRAAERPVGRLAGIPVAVKDIFCTKGIVTTAGSRLLEGYRPPYDATVVERLRDAGTVLVGKTNMDEFAMGSSTENSGYGPTRNPWDLTRVPGGSSGGSAAALAAGQVTLAVGTDTGGSIRQPAALCGVVGLKPTYGLVSRYGMLAFASSLDQAGPMTKDVRDAALMLSVLAGNDPRDATSIPDTTAAVDYLEGLDRGVEGLRIGLVDQLWPDEGLDAAVRVSVETAVARLEALGAHVRRCSAPSFTAALPAYYLIAPAECSSNLARYDGVRWGRRAEGARDVVDMMQRTRSEGFGPEVKRRIMLGTYALSAGYYDAYYGTAQKVRTLVARDLASLWNDVDLLVGPTTPTTAFGLGERINDPVAMYLSDVFTVPVNLAGAPALSLPVGFDEGGLPVGLQFIAPVLGEARLLQAAYALEQDLGVSGSASLAATASANHRGSAGREERR